MNLKQGFKVIVCMAAMYLLLSAVSCVVFGAELQTVPLLDNPSISTDNGETLIGGGKPGDKGLKPIDTPKFDLPQPDVFAGVRIALWGLSIAGAIVGIFVAVLIVMVAVKFLRKVAVPAVTGVPAGSSSAVLQVLDSALDHLKERRRSLLKESAQIDKRLGKPKKASAAKKKAKA